MRLFLRMLGCSRAARRLCMAALLFALFAGALTLTGPFMVGKMVDLAAGQGKVDFAGISRLLPAALFLFLLGALLQYLAGLLSARAAAMAVTGLREQIFTHLSRWSAARLDTLSPGELSSRLTNDADAAADGLAQGVSLFSGVFVILISFVFMFVLSPLLALGVLALSPLAFFLAVTFAKGVRRHFESAARLQGQLAATAEESLTHLRVLQAYGATEARFVQFSSINHALYRPGFASQFYAALINPFTRLVNSITFALAAAGGVLLFVTTGSPSVGSLLAFLSYSQQYAKPANEVSGLWAQLQQAHAAMERLFAVLDAPLEQLPGNIPAPEGESEIAFQNVRFSYTPDSALFNGLSFILPANGKTALVGATGSGKTTVLQLLLRFYPLQGGDILLGGQSIFTLEPASLRARFALVGQDPFIFNGTVWENITFGKSSREDAERAAQMASAHEFIEKLAGGYETEIAPGQLSAGQRQLLSIARAMHANPPILLLDEATSNIDLRTERSVYKALDTLMQGRTSLIVAHRLSTVMDADLILVMDNGRIAEQGTHDELLGRGGVYAKLFRSQFLGVTEEERPAAPS